MAGGDPAATVLRIGDYSLDVRQLGQRLAQARRREGTQQRPVTAADLIAHLDRQGPKAIGMPELHKLTPCLGILQDKGYKVALITDGRMSGASGKVPAAIHVTPEAENGGPIAKIRDGDMIRIDAVTGELMVLVDEKEFEARPVAVADLSSHQFGVGRDLFTAFRANVGTADSGAHVFGA